MKLKEYPEERKKGILPLSTCMKQLFKKYNFDTGSKELEKSRKLNISFIRYVRL